MVWRLLETGYEPLEESLSPEEVEQQLLDRRLYALQEAVIHSVFGESNDETRKNKIAHLRSLGLLDIEGDENAIRANIVQRFQNFFGRHHEERLPGKWKRHLFFEAAKLLVATGVLRLNTCRDWQVNRKNEAENLGLKSFEKFEDFLWKKYGEDSGRKRFYHLHAGSGDNSGVYQANVKRDKGDKTWRHIGFGNKLYAPIETLIGQFLRRKYRDDATMHPTDPEVRIVIRILTEAIQKKLHEKWYSPEKGVTEDATWTPAAERQDLNEILTLLKNPRELLAGIDFPHAVSIHVAKYQLSGRFTGNKPTSVSDTELAEQPSATERPRSQDGSASSARDAVVGAYTTLMELSEMPDTLIRHERLEFLAKDAEATLGRITNVINKVRKMQNVLAHDNREQYEKMCAELEEEIRNLLPIELAELVLSAIHLEGMEDILQEAKSHYITRMKWIRGESPLKPGNCDDLEMTLPEAYGNLTSHDKLLSEERTLQWTLDQIKHAHGPISSKLQKFYEDSMNKAREILPPMDDDATEHVPTLLKNYLEHIREALSKDPTPNRSHIHEVFEHFFEPEFVAAIERESSEAPEPSEWRLINANDMGTGKSLEIPDIPANAVIRAEGMEVTDVPQRVPMTDFMIHRKGTTVFIDGLDVVEGKQRVLPDYRIANVQTAFTLEVTTELDLNERPYAYLRNFVPGNFNEITDCFPPESFGLISAIRSDSHIGDEDFTTLSADYVKLLQPGGVVITDGNEESYSQVIRLIRSLPPDEAKVEVVMSSKTHRPIALMIQKAHADGYMADVEKREQFQEHVYFKSPEEIAVLRPDEELLHDICSEIRAVCGHGAFTWIGDQLSLDREGSPSRLRELITAAVVGQKLNRNPLLATPELKRSIARHIVERHNLKTGNPQPSLISADLKDEKDEPVDTKDVEAIARLLPNLQGLPLRTVWRIRQEIMRVLDPSRSLETSDAVKAIERCIVNAFCDEEMARRTTTPEKPRRAEQVRAMERRATMDRLFDEGRNIAYAKHPTLTQEDIGYIQRRIANRALRAIDKGRHIMDPENNPLRQTPGVIRQFRRRGDKQELEDVRTTLLRDNHQFTTPEAAERLRVKIESVRRIVKELAEATGHAPIGFIKFMDCVTNDLLEERLEEIFGGDMEDLVDFAECAFITHGNIATIRDKGELKHKLASWADGKNRLVFGGGSWENAFESHGILLKKMLSDLFRQTLGDQNIRMFGICFFNQILGDMVGALPPPIGIAPARTEPGPLEVGLARITPTGDGLTHPLFADCAEAFTGIMSRAGYPKGDDLHEKGKVMKTLARSGSGGTAAWEAFDKFIGIQWHPEVRCVEQGKDISEDSERMLQQLADQRGFLRQIFDCEPEELRPNFDAKRAEIRGDAGQEILVNALLHQLTQLQQNLRLPSQAPAK